MKHSPGPFTVNGVDIMSGVSTIASVTYHAQLPWQANARLIAAAPDLLEALVEIIAAADGKGWEQLDPGMGNARAAIKKATGETKC